MFFCIFNGVLELVVGLVLDSELIDWPEQSPCKSQFSCIGFPKLPNWRAVFSLLAILVSKGRMRLGTHCY